VYDYIIHFTFMLPCIVSEFFLNNQPDALIIQIYSVIKFTFTHYGRINVPNTPTASRCTQHKTRKIRIKDIINKVVSDCIIYILYYILSYIQHKGDVSLENWTLLVYTKEVGPQL